MPTTNSTTSKWRSNRSGGLSRSQAALISSYWTEIARYLAPPGVTWEWSESGVPHQVKYRWKMNGLIHRAPGGEGWMTMMTLWCHVIDAAADDEVIGAEATGQETLPVPEDTSPEETRVLAASRDTARRGPVRFRQSTLTGGIVDVGRSEDGEEPSKLTVNWAKGAPAVSPREKAAQHPAQTELTTWTRTNGNDPRWDVTVTVPTVSRPNGRYYYPAGTGGRQDEQATLAVFQPRRWTVTVSE